MIKLQPCIFHLTGIMKSCRYIPLLYMGGWPFLVLLRNADAKWCFISVHSLFRLFQTNTDPLQLDKLSVLLKDILLALHTAKHSSDRECMTRTS